MPRTLYIEVDPNRADDACDAIEAAFPKSEPVPVGTTEDRRYVVRIDNAPTLLAMERACYGYFYGPKRRRYTAPLIPGDPHPWSGTYRPFP